jgi:hypothetical protein
VGPEASTVIEQKNDESAPGRVPTARHNPALAVIRAEGAIVRFTLPARET